jgi:hypothetical protein
MAHRRGQSPEEASDLAANILAQAGNDEEVTDAEAEAVIAELFGKGGGRAEIEGPLQTLLPGTRKSLELASRSLKAAVAHDSNGDSTLAIENYERSLMYFTEGCVDPALGEKPTVACLENMTSALDRALALRILSTPQFSTPQPERHIIFEAMSNRGFSALKRGVGLYKQSKESPLEDWAVFVMFSEAMECLLTYMKSPNGNSSNPMVVKCVGEMLSRTESIKAAHTHVS